MWISKQSSIRCRGARFGNSMDSILSVQNQNFSRNRTEFTEIAWSRLKSRKSSTLTIRWNLAKFVNIFPGIIVRQHLTVQKQMGLPKEQCAEWKKGHLRCYCRPVWMKKWWADSTESYCYLRNIRDLLSDGKTPCERRFVEPFKRPRIPFGSMVEYHPIAVKDLSRRHQFGKKVGYASHAGGIWKGDILRNWKRWTHLKSMLGDSMRKKC